LMLAAGVSTSFVSCVDTDEPSSIEELRKAKANEVNAQAAYKNALAALENQKVETEKQVTAQAVITTQLRDLEKQAYESSVAVQKANDAVTIAKHEWELAHEKANGVYKAAQDEERINNEQAKIIAAANAAQVALENKQKELEYAQAQAKSDLDKKNAELQNTIGIWQNTVTQQKYQIENSAASIEWNQIKNAAEAGEKDQTLLNLLSEKEAAQTNYQSKYTALISAQQALLVAQSNLATAVYKTAVKGTKTIAEKELAVTQKEVAATTAKTNLEKLQALDGNTDFETYETEYKKAQDSIDNLIPKLQAARELTYGKKKDAKTAANTAYEAAKTAYNNYIKPYQDSLTAVQDSSYFYDYDISAADYATLLSYLVDNQNNFDKKISGAKLPTKAGDGTYFRFDKNTNKFLTLETKKEIKNSDYETAIAELYKEGTNYTTNPYDVSGTIGQFIAKTKDDKESKETAETNLKTQEKELFRSENVKSDFVPTDDRALVYIYFDAKKKYTDAFENLRTAKKNYNSAVATVESTKKAQENAQKAFDENTDATKTAALQLALDNAKNAYNNAVQNLNNDEKDKIGVKALLIGSTYDADKYPGAIPTYNKCVTEFHNACKDLFGANYAAKANKFAKTLVTETDLDDTKHNGLALNEEVKRNEEDATGFKPSDITSNSLDNAPRFVFDLPDRLKAEDLAKILGDKKLTDYDADIYGTKFGISTSKYVEYLYNKNVVIPEWANKIKADEEAAKFVTTVQASTVKETIKQTLARVPKSIANANSKLYAAYKSTEATTLKADRDDKKVAYDEATKEAKLYAAPKDAAGNVDANYVKGESLVYDDIDNKKTSFETLKAVYESLMKTAYNSATKGVTLTGITFDADKFDDVYKKAVAELKKQKDFADYDLKVAKEDLAAAQNGEAYGTGTVNGMAYTSEEEYMQALNNVIVEAEENIKVKETEYNTAKTRYEAALKAIADYKTE